MSGDPLKDVQPGETLHIRAPTWNLHNQAARDHLARQHDRRRQARPHLPERGVVLLKNNSGYDCARGNILGIDDFVVPYDAAYIDEFQQSLAVVGSTPDIAKHRGRFAVLLDPIADGDLGRGIVSGVAHVQVYVPAGDYTRADIKDGDRAKLEVDPGGAAVILARHKVATTSWAIVNIGQPAATSDTTYRQTAYTITGSSAQSVKLLDGIDPFRGAGWTDTTQSLFTCTRPGRYRFTTIVTATPSPPKPTVDPVPSPEEVDSYPRTIDLWIVKSGGTASPRVSFTVETKTAPNSGIVFLTSDFTVGDTLECKVQAVDAGPSETTWISSVIYELASFGTRF